MKDIKIWFANFKASMKKLKKEVAALYLAYKRPDVPWYAKAFIILVVGYALSPIDLIPDFIPVFGYLDDLVLIPMGVAIAIRLIPENIMQECREQAADVFREGKPKNLIAAGIIILIWLAVLCFVTFKVISLFK